MHKNTFPRKVEHKIEQLKSQVSRVTSLRKLSEVEALFNELDAMRWSISERQGEIGSKVQETMVKIERQEPAEAGVRDMEKLRRAFDSLSTDFEVFWSQTTTKIEEYRRTCTFAKDLERMDNELHDLNEHLKKVDTKIGENLQTARVAASSFVQFEKTVTVRIVTILSGWMTIFSKILLTCFFISVFKLLFLVIEIER